MVSIFLKKSTLSMEVNIEVPFRSFINHNKDT